MFTKPQDIVVALKLCLESARRSYAQLGQELGMSASEVHAAVRRLGEARVIVPETRKIRREALRNFLIHGVPHAFPASPKEVTRGMPTAWAAPVLSGKIRAAEQIPPVWPDPDGQVQGAAVQPLVAADDANNLAVTRFAAKLAGIFTRLSNGQRPHPQR